VCSNVAENITKEDTKKLKTKLDLIKKSTIWLDFKVRTYEFFYFIYLLSNNKYYIHFFEEVIEDRKKLNFDGKLIQNKVSKIVVINAYLSLNKIYRSINEKKSEESYNASKEYLSNILISMHL
jgi:DNA-binding FadR family transcriptional regulator